MRIDTSGQRIETWNSGRGLAVLGALLAAAGAWGVFVLVGEGHHGIMAGDRPAGPQDAWLPALIGLGGLALAGFRGRGEIDLGARQRLSHRRFWWNASSKREPLGEPRHVSFRAERRGSGKNSRIAYVVRLVTSEGEFEVACPSNERKGRLQAEALARMCDVALHDLRGGGTRVRAPADLDRSILDRDEGRATGPVAVPRPCRVNVTRDGRRTRIRVGAPGMWLLPLGLLPTCLPVGFFLFFWLPGVRSSSSGLSAGGAVFWIAIPLLICVVPLGALAAAAHRGGLLPCSLVVEDGVLRVGRTRFAADELEELHVASGGPLFGSHLRVESDRTARRVGRGLSSEELDYLRVTILQALRGSRCG